MRNLKPDNPLEDTAVIPTNTKSEINFLSLYFVYKSVLFIFPTLH